MDICCVAKFIESFWNRTDDPWWSIVLIVLSFWCILTAIMVVLGSIKNVGFALFGKGNENYPRGWFTMLGVSGAVGSVFLLYALMCGSFSEIFYLVTLWFLLPFGLCVYLFLGIEWIAQKRKRVE